MKVTLMLLFMAVAMTTVLAGPGGGRFGGRFGGKSGRGRGFGRRFGVEVDCDAIGGSCEELVRTQGQFRRQCPTADTRPVGRCDDEDGHCCVTDAEAQAYCTGSDVGGECVDGTYTTGDNRARTRSNFFRAVQSACPDGTSLFSLNDDDKPFLCAKGEGTFSVCCVDDDE